MEDSLFDGPSFSTPGSHINRMSLSALNQPQSKNSLVEIPFDQCDNPGGSDDRLEDIEDRHIRLLEKSIFAKK